MSQIIKPNILKLTLLPLTAIAMLSGCDSDTDNEDTMTPFTLNFSAMSGSETVDCDTSLSGFGDSGHYSIGVSDLRFYVSNLAFYDQYGEQIEISLDDNDFQLNHDEGAVALIDLTSNTSGSCLSDNAGTERTNNVLTGMTMDTGINKVTFDIGVPQAVMKDVIATNSAEDAPSPLHEMYWSWASGYRHFVMNFEIEDMSANQGDGFIHIGSRSCGTGVLALEDTDTCDFVNTAKVELDNFDPSVDSVTIDIDALLADLPFYVEMAMSDDSDDHSDHSSDMAMNTPSVTCHSADPSMQPDCAEIFANLGLDTTDGTSDAATNSVVTAN